MASTILFDCSSFSTSIFLFLYADSSKSIFSFLLFCVFNPILQYSCGINFSISSSLSQIILVAADCTLPALSPFLTFAHNIGYIL